tara:strand:+ start:5638 stop:5985 length:348 start_codon:yes stop_codon:yes gene_type:complete
MSRGGGSGGSSRGKGNSRRHSMSKSQRDKRSNSLNPNNSANKAARDNRSNQLNPNNQTEQNPSETPSTSGRWSQRMDSKSASRIQSHSDKKDTNKDFKARAQSASKKNEKESKTD